MSIYTYLTCPACNESFWVGDVIDKGRTTMDHVSSHLADFMTKHRKHNLVFDWENDNIDKMNRFKPDE